MHLVNKIAIGAWAIVAGCFVVWALAIYEPDFSAEYQAAAAQNQTTLRVSEVGCVSVDARKGVIYDQKEYSDSKLAEAITNILSIKNVHFDADIATCPWNFMITGISGRDYNVTYGEKFSRYLVSISICDRKPEGQTGANKCLSKNIYVFNRNVEPHKLFLLALVGFARPQAAEWEIYQVSKEQL